MTINRIQRYRNSKIISREDSVLNTAWISDNTSIQNIPDGQWVRQKNNWDLSPSGDPVLAMLGNVNEDSAAQDWLMSQSNSGIRSYALSSPEHGDLNQDSALHSMTDLLIRRIPEVPVSAIITKTSSVIWIGSGLSLRLDSSQAAYLKQAFLRLFWHDATDEAWSSQGKLVWRKASERPFDIPILPSSKPVYLSTAIPLSTTHCEILHIKSGVPPENGPRLLWVHAGPNHHDILQRLSNKGAEIVWSDTGLPSIKIGLGNDPSELLVSGHKIHLKITLNEGQRDELTAILKAKPTWKFKTNLKIGDPDLTSAKFWLPNEVSPCKLIPEEVIPVPEITAHTLREMQNIEPSNLPEPKKLALRVKYEWSTKPPCAPPGLAEDALYQEWKAIDETWTRRLNKAKENLVHAENKGGGLQAKFKKILSAMMGYKLTNEKLRKEIAKFESSIPSKSAPNDSLNLFTELHKLEEEVKKLQIDLEDEERKADEAEAREKWELEVNAAKSEIPKKKKELKDTQEEAARVRLNKEQEIANLESSDEKTKKDLDARINKLSDEIQSLDNMTKRIEVELEDLIIKSESVFEYTKPVEKAPKFSKIGAKFVPKQTESDNVIPPKEALPIVGKLGSHKKQRYLVIDCWSLLDEGEKEAQRLSAKLVAPEIL